MAEEMLSSPTDETPLVMPADTSSGWKKLLGWAFIIFCVANDIAQSEYTQVLCDQLLLIPTSNRWQWKYGSLEFKSYFFLTWITSVTLVLSFPLFVVVDFLRFQVGRTASHTSSYRDDLISALAPVQALSCSTLLAASFSTLFLFFISTYLWYLNLDMVPVSVSFALSHSEILFVLALSWWLLRATVTWKQCAVLCCLIAGLALLTAGAGFAADLQLFYHFVGSSRTKLWGSGIVFLATFLWGLYEVIFKRFFSNFNAHSLMLLQTLWGLEIIAAALVIFPVLWTSKLEAPPPTDSASLEFLLTSVLFAAPYFVVYPLAVAFTSPFEVSLGSLCSIPATAILDRLLWGTTYPVVSIVGITVVALTLLLHGVLERKSKHSHY